VAACLRGADSVVMTPRTLVTVRPGPVLHLWQDGRQIAAVPLDPPAARASLSCPVEPRIISLPGEALARYPCRTTLHCLSFRGVSCFPSRGQIGR
jgi:hypothetical protein